MYKGWFYAVIIIVWISIIIYFMVQLKKNK